MDHPNITFSHQVHPCYCHFELYMKLEGSANADATILAKYQDLQPYLEK